MKRSISLYYTRSGHLAVHLQLRISSHMYSTNLYKVNTLDEPAQLAAYVTVLIGVLLALSPLGSLSTRLGGDNKKITQ